MNHSAVQSLVSLTVIFGLLMCRADYASTRFGFSFIKKFKTSIMNSVCASASAVVLAYVAVAVAVPVSVRAAVAT